jgi:hypothetical protein
VKGGRSKERKERTGGHGHREGIWKGGVDRELRRNEEGKEGMRDRKESAWAE